MDAVEFFKTANRLCKNQRCCTECPIHKNGMGCMVNADDDSIKLKESRKQFQKSNNGQKSIPSIPARASFLRMFPNADLCRDVIDISPCSIEKEMRKCCGDRNCDECKRTYWLAEVTDNGNVY